MRTGSNLAREYPPTEVNVSTLRLVSATQTDQDPLDQLLNRKAVRTHIREFALVISIVLALVACYFASKSSFFIAAALVGAAAGLTWFGYHKPQSIHGLWKGWMAVGAGLGMVVTTILLSFIWALMFIPMGLGLKIAGKFVMNMKFREARPSYWEERNPDKNDFRLLEKQY